LSDNKPDFYVYHVKDIDDETKSHWTRIGAAWQHQDMKGFNISLDIVPLDGSQLVLREPKARERAA